MGRFLGLVLVIAAAVTGLGYVFTGLDNQVKRLKFEVARAEVKKRFAARVPHIANSDEEHAAFDLTQGVKNYYKDMVELYKTYPEFNDPDSVLKRYEKEYQEKKRDELQMRNVRERIALVKEVREKLISGEYKFVTTAHDKTVRMDITKIEKKSSEGEEKLFVHTLFMGLPAEKGVVAFGPINMDIPLEDDEATAKKRAAKQLVDNKQERKAQISGGGEPNTMVTEPDKFVEDFPPGLTIAFYNFPLFPAESKHLDLSFSFDVKNPGGGHVNNEIKFKPMDVKPEWRTAGSYAADE